MYQVAVENVNNTLSERKTQYYLSKYEFGEIKQGSFEMIFDCQKNPTDSICQDNNDWRVAYSEDKIETGNVSYNRTKSLNSLPMEMCQKYRERLPNLYELCSTINGVNYSLISSIIVLLILLI